jgi:microcin C transport system substrate-binding protein
MRRAALACLALVSALIAAPPARSAEERWSHGLSLVGELKYPEGFRHFEYVNPDAPKGGVVRLGVPGGFDNFNLAVSEVKGNIAAGLADGVYETLLARAEDEISAEYGLIAEAVSHPPDYSSATFRLNPKARWHDGKPVTPEDVIFSFDAFKRLSPLRNKYYGDVEKAEKTGERLVTFRFSTKNNRELPQILGQLNILPKHWWEGERADGAKRSIEEVTQEPPLGSGPYRLKSFINGRSIVYERVKDYWGADLPVRIGTNNFDELRIEYFRDPAALFDGFKADEYDYRIENSARNWMTQYVFPAAAAGKIMREEFPIRDFGIMQAFAPNIRREKFADIRVRKALNLAFNFEKANKDVFFGLYKRVDSYFSGTELAASGLPSGRELEILEALRDKLPKEIFETPYANPLNDADAALRANLREALRLMNEAGWELNSGKLVSKTTGQPFVFDILFEVSMGSLVEPYKQSLERIGFTVNLRSLDDVQYENVKRSFDFDMLAIESWAQSLSPGNEQRDYWGSTAADKPGSRNLMGVKDPAIDSLIETVIFARDRDELVAATRALDRALLAGHYVVPQWTSGFTRTARWDRFSHPARMPEYGRGSFPTIWWYDEAKAAKAKAP